MNKKFSFLKFNKVISLCLLTLLIQSCATSSFKERAFQYSLIGGLIGGAYGVTRKELKTQNASMYGSIGAVAGGAVALMTDNTDEEIKELKAKVKFFNDINFEKSTLNLNQELPEEYKQILKTHHYDVYKINEWSMRGPKLLVRESDIIEIKDKKNEE